MNRSTFVYSIALLSPASEGVLRALEEPYPIAFDCGQGILIQIDEADWLQVRYPDDVWPLIRHAAEEGSTMVYFNPHGGFIVEGMPVYER